MDEERDEKRDVPIRIGVEPLFSFVDYEDKDRRQINVLEVLG